MGCECLLAHESSWVIKYGLTLTVKPELNAGPDFREVGGCGRVAGSLGKTVGGFVTGIARVTFDPIYCNRCVVARGNNL